MCSLFLFLQGNSRGLLGHCVHLTKWKDINKHLSLLGGGFWTKEMRRTTQWIWTELKKLLSLKFWKAWILIWLQLFRILGWHLPISMWNISWEKVTHNCWKPVKKCTDTIPSGSSVLFCVVGHFGTVWSGQLKIDAARKRKRLLKVAIKKMNGKENKFPELFVSSRFLIVLPCASFLRVFSGSLIFDNWFQEKHKKWKLPKLWHFSLILCSWICSQMECGKWMDKGKQVEGKLFPTAQ